MRVLITGAAGKIGHQTVLEAVKAGHEVVATDNQYREGLPVPLRLADLREGNRVYELMEGVDAVIHLGNIPNAYGASPPQKVLSDNTAMNGNIFAAAVHLGVNRMVFVSSIQVITGTDIRFELPRHASPKAPQPRPLFPYLPVDGREPQNPGLNFYALSKALGEQCLEMMTRSRPAMVGTAVRFPYCATTQEIDRHMSRSFSKHVFRSVEAVAYLNVEDAATMLLACLKQEQPGYRVYMPCQSMRVTGMSARQFAQRYMPEVELRPEIDEVDELSDIRRIATDLGWTPGRPPLMIPPLTN